MRLIFFCLFIHSAAFAQYSMEDLKMLVQNNIVTFHISKLVNEEISVYDNKKFLKSNFKGSTLNTFMEGQKMELKLNIIPSSFTFPDTNYILYEVKLDKFQFRDTLEGVSLIFNLAYYCFNYSHKYLIAKHKKKDKMLFISGNCFKNKIVSYFPSEMSEKEVFFFLQLKFYSYGAKILSIKSKRKKWIVEYSYENSPMTKTMSVLKDNPDNLALDCF
jgi:hypothetical protein